MTSLKIGYNSLFLRVCLDLFVCEQACSCGKAEEKIPINVRCDVCGTGIPQGIRDCCIFADDIYRNFLSDFPKNASVWSKNRISHSLSGPISYADVNTLPTVSVGLK